MARLTSAVMALAAACAAWGQSVFDQLESPVPIYLELRAEMFPPEWRDSPIEAKALPLPGDQRERSLAIVGRAMARYPADLLRRNLAAVYVCGGLTFYGVPYGGTNSADTLYLTNRGAEAGYSDAYLEGSFHHEFSSVLLRNYSDRFDAERWQALNPPGFQYGLGGAEAIRTGAADTSYNDQHIERGFLSQYSTASLEEDFNMVAQGLFVGGTRFWKAVETSKPLSEKVQMVLEFYRSVSPGFDPTEGPVALRRQGESR